HYRRDRHALELCRRRAIWDIAWGVGWLGMQGRGGNQTELGPRALAFRSLRAASLPRRSAITNHLDECEKMSAGIRRHILERADEPQRPRGTNEPKRLIDVAGRGLRPRRAIEKERDRHPEGIGNLGQSAGSNPVHPFFVFLNLLERDAERIGQL